MTRTVFYAFGAYVGQINSPTSVGFWPDDPANLNWAAGALVPIDLGRNPQAARSGKIQIADIQADDYAGYTFGGMTRIGPMWPGGVMNGIVWMDSNYWATLAPRGIQPSRVPPGMQARPYEFTMVLYWDGPLQHRRFQGLYGEIHSTQGTSALITLWQPGTSQVPGQNPIGTWWIDLAQQHPVEPGFTEIGVAQGAPKQGAVFLDMALRKVHPFACPKVPKDLGGAIPRSRHVDR